LDVSKLASSKLSARVQFCGLGRESGLQLVAPVGCQALFRLALCLLQLGSDPVEIG
jgi:hypothetical protein